ncbi:MAG: hypothetical protein K8U03_18085 [Planctomycetia bacterium]|nr:hypothetical protein [Planctomycetia bacterium]
MQINGIAKQLLNPLSLGQSNPSSGSSSPIAALDRPKATGGTTGGAEFHEILSRYDVSAITPRELGDLAQELHGAGEITDIDLRDLNKVRADLEQDGIDSDQPVDLTSMLEKKLAQSTAARDALRAQKPSVSASDLMAADKEVAEKNRQLEWIRKFALVQASGAVGIDTGA